MRTFKCAGCGKIMQSDTSEEEMMKEYVDNFGVFITATDQRDEICGECYNFAMMQIAEDPGVLQQLKEHLLSNMRN